MDPKLTAALNIIRRMPPATVENSLAGLVQLSPELTDDLLNHVDQPLKLETDTKTGKQFILCDYNRDGNSYRSPWSNAYYPPSEDGDEFFPPEHLRQLEVELNLVFDVYRKLYFEGGSSSVYCFETDENNDKAFGACFLIHKEVESKELKQGWWDSIHVFEVEPESKTDQYTYKLTSTVLVSMALENETVGKVDLSGHMTKQKNQSSTISRESGKTHLSNMGTMLEDLELQIRNDVEGIYIQKTREVMNGMRNPDQAKLQAWAEVTKSLSAAVASHGLRS